MLRRSNKQFLRQYQYEQFFDWYLFLKISVIHIIYNFLHFSDLAIFEFPIIWKTVNTIL